MARVLEDQPPTDGRAARATSSRAVPTRRALEVVALRGKDVIGVRHVLRGGRAWLGQSDDSIARVPMAEFGGAPMVVAEHGIEAVVNVPPGARARIHPKHGLARITVGPERVVLGEGDRTVVIVGGVQLRAQVVSIETFARALTAGAGSARWLVVIGALYVAALAICAALAPNQPADPGEGHVPAGAVAPVP